MEMTHVGKLAGLSKGVNDRLMTMKLPLSIQKKKKACHHHQHLCSIHDQPGRSDLHSVMATVPKADKLIILGDFNARTGSDNVSWDSDNVSWDSENVSWDRVIIGQYGDSAC